VGRCAVEYDEAEGPIYRPEVAQGMWSDGLVEFSWH
jgi:hypothetical protein